MPATDPETEVRYPTRLLTEDEEIVREFRPHWRVLLPALGWAMLAAALGGIGVAALDGTARTVSVVAAVVLWVLLAGRSLLDYWFTNYVLTTERIIVRTGMIARSGTEIPLENINNVLFNQTVLERLLGFGDVLLESAGAQGQSRLEDIPDPELFQSQVYRVREARSLAMRHGPGPADHAAGDVVSQLERLADLRERGHLSEEEFEAKKRRLLDG
ncbi:PH domain-containing protein [Nitriliruptoraceae bacterium ZYF776]|nr:PH domain-containing protein [Profundirhabdus halotolerans]